VLVRHGLSSFNIEHRIQGRDDFSTLTGDGAAQARAVGKSLAELPIDAYLDRGFQAWLKTAGQY
jgi:probable phosphoglycerate mutase